MLSRKRAAALIVALVIGLVPEILIAHASLVGHGPTRIVRWMLARDFTDFWSAAHLAWAGRVHIIFHPMLFQGWLERRFAFVHGTRLWSYPPNMLFLVLPVGLLGPVAGFVVWSLMGLAGLGAALALVVPKRDFWATMLLICVLPVVWDDIQVGQNAAFTGALLIAGFVWLERRPGWAGVAFGLLTIKPQLGLLVPVAMLAARRWRTIGVAALVALGLAGLSALIFRGSWRLFFAHVEPAMQLRLVRAYVPTPSQAYMSSAFVAARALHWGVGFAWLVQGLVIALAGMAILRLWRRDNLDAGASRSRVAASVALCLAATPFSLDYDAVGATVMLLALIVTQGQSRRQDWFELALLAIAVPGWGLILALAFPIPVFPWLIWLALGCWEAFAPEQIHRAPAISAGRAR
jgi:hypothetical protein